MELTQKRVRELFDYREDGALIAKERAKGRKLGLPVGTNSNGYLITMVEGRLYKVHRLVFLWHHGYVPAEIDHKDLDPGNNRIENLRPASSADNKRNRGRNGNNTSGFKGVCYDKRRNKWAAQITIDYKHKFLGYHATPEDAAAAYEKAAIHYHGEFARVA